LVKKYRVSSTTFELRSHNSGPAFCTDDESPSIERRIDVRLVDEENQSGGECRGKDNKAHPERRTFVLQNAGLSTSSASKPEIPSWSSDRQNTTIEIRHAREGEASPRHTRRTSGTPRNERTALVLPNETRPAAIESRPNLRCRARAVLSPYSREPVTGQYRVPGASAIVRGIAHGD